VLFNRKRYSKLGRGVTPHRARAGVRGGGGLAALPMVHFTCIHQLLTPSGELLHSASIII
jgi:hypothetical protein